jgi:16S rRNA (cytosine967-C5)-methyltransferase
MSRYPVKPDRAAQAPPTPPGFPARRAALRLLDAVLRRGDPLELALHAATQGVNDRADKALAHAIAADVLRHMGNLDALIDSATQQILPNDAKARMVLRMALVQLLILGTPPHAVIATSLPLMDGGPRRLVHGILGTLIRAEARLPDTPALPAEVATRWSGHWGEEVTASLALALANRAPIDLTLTHADETHDWAEKLGGTSLAPRHVRMRHDASVAGLAGYDEGAWWVQDLAASIPARLAGAGEGRVAIDLCAAPGGKTMQLAAQGWNVIALDKSAKRLERLHQNLLRSGLDARVEQGDALGWRPETNADLVLLDAPCSATGIYRRHPDVLHRVGDRQIAEMVEIQHQMLDHAAQMVTVGGTLIYATCSLEPAEGEQQITDFLARNADFQITAPKAGELPSGIEASANGTIRTRPDMLTSHGGIDGFFIARMRRIS